MSGGLWNLGNEKYDERLCVTIPKSFRKQLEKLAIQAEKSLSGITRELIRLGIEAKSNGEDK